MSVAIEAMFHVSEVGETVAVPALCTGVAAVNTTPGAAGIVTERVLSNPTAIDVRLAAPAPEKERE